MLLVAVTVDIVDHCQWAMEEVKTTGTTKVKPPTGTAAPIVNSDDDDDVVPSNSRFLH